MKKQVKRRKRSTREKREVLSLSIGDSQTQQGAGKAVGWGETKRRGGVDGTGR